MEEKGSVHRISRESLPDWGRQDVKQQPVSWEKKQQCPVVGDERRAMDNTMVI